MLIKQNVCWFAFCKVYNVLAEVSDIAYHALFVMGIRSFLSIAGNFPSMEVKSNACIVHSSEWHRPLCEHLFGCVKSEACAKPFRAFGVSALSYVVQHKCACWLISINVFLAPSELKIATD